MKFLGQESFDPLEYGSREEALKARNNRAAALRKDGFKTKCFVLKNQLKPYAGLGVPDGRVRDIFMIDVFEK